MNTVDKIQKIQSLMYFEYALSIGKKFGLFEENVKDEDLVNKIKNKYVESKLEEIIKTQPEISEDASIAKISLESLVDTYKSMNEYLVKNFKKSGAYGKARGIARFFGFLGGGIGLLIRGGYDISTAKDAVLTFLAIAIGGTIGYEIGKSIALKNMAKGNNIGQNLVDEYLSTINRNLFEYSLATDLKESTEIAKRIYELNQEYKQSFSL